MRIDFMRVYLFVEKNFLKGTFQEREKCFLFLGEQMQRQGAVGANDPILTTFPSWNKSEILHANILYGSLPFCEKKFLQNFLLEKFFF